MREDYDYEIGVYDGWRDVDVFIGTPVTGLYRDFEDLYNAIDFVYQAHVNDFIYDTDPIRIIGFGMSNGYITYTEGGELYVAATPNVE